MADSTHIMVAYAAVGSGHRMAADAVARALEKCCDANVRVDTIDVLSCNRSAPSGESLTSAFTGPGAAIYNAAWSSSVLGSVARGLGGPVLASIYREFVRTVLAEKPAAVVCTHALPALLAARLVYRGALEAPVISVATDFGVHTTWPKDGIALFCTANQTSADKLLERGFDTSSVAVTGIPVRKQFAIEYDIVATRQHFGLSPERRVILALAGSTMAGPYEHLKESLAVSLPALASLPGVDVAVVTGRDTAFAEELRSRVAGFGTTNVHIMGFVEHMAPLMATSDLALAKPGGLVCAECVNMCLPLVLVGPAVGQERANVVALREAGAALFAEDPRTLAEYLRKAIAGPHRLAKMKASTEQLARPRAAEDVAERVLELAGAKAT